MNSNYYLVIMAGGVGSRFWPVSSEELPKQFLDILGTGRTLLQLTADRFRHSVPATNRFIFTFNRFDEQIVIHPAASTLGSHFICWKENRVNYIKELSGAVVKFILVSIE